jgi:hypothetical protein
VREHSSTRRGVLNATGTLLVGSLTATAGCLGGDSGPDLDGDVTVEGVTEGVSTERTVSTTESGYELSLTVRNDSDSPRSCAAEVVWTDDAGENVEVTATETGTADAGGDATLVTSVEDPENAVAGYSATVLVASG